MTIDAMTVRGLARYAARQGCPLGRAYRLDSGAYQMPAGSYTDYAAAYDDERAEMRRDVAPSAVGLHVLASALNMRTMRLGREIRPLAVTHRDVAGGLVPREATHIMECGDDGDLVAYRYVTL